MENEINIIESLIKQNKLDNQNIINALNLIIEKINATEKDNNEKLKLLSKKININEKEQTYANLKALKVFKNINEFKNFTENLYNVKEWEIYPDTYKNRAKKLCSFEYWKQLKQLFEKQNLINKKISEEQLVSYFDTMNLLYYILKYIENKNIREEMKIIMEYQINTLEKERPDYLLIYRNEIIILEFGNATNYNNIKKSKAKKLEQLNEYENNLKNRLINKNIIYHKIPVIYLSDEDFKFNKNLIKDIAEQIINILNDNNFSAFESILNNK